MPFGCAQKTTVNGNGDGLAGLDVVVAWDGVVETSFYRRRVVATMPALVGDQSRWVARASLRRRCLRLPIYCASGQTTESLPTTSPTDYSPYPMLTRTQVQIKGF